MTIKSTLNRREVPASLFSSTLLADRLEAVARVRSEAIAIVDGQRRMSYRELLLRADALARELEAREIGPRDLVGIALPRSAELVVAVVGIVRAGAAYVPIDLNQPVERRSLILSDARPKLVVTEGAQVEGIPSGIRMLGLPRDVPEVIERRRRPRVEDPAYVIYTSGSTGQPKGVVVTQHNAARLFIAAQPLFKFDTNDVWPLFHSIGFDFSVWELWGALLNGGRLVVVPALTARAADAFHALVIREGVTVLNQTPSAFRAFDAADAAAGRPRNQLRHVVFAGEALDPRSLKDWFESHGEEQPRLANMYGITETTVHVTYRRMVAEDADGTGTSLVGTPLADLRIDLLDADDQLVAPGEVGEIFVGGEGVSSGYLGHPELTAERFLPDPRGEHPNARLYRSGDLGRRTPDGDLEYLGRIDNQVKLRGFRIELGEIEVALCKAASVRAAVVALHNSSVKGPQLIAYVVQDECEPLDAWSLREHVAHHLPDYMVPAAYVRIQQVPRTINDKVDRAALPSPSAQSYPGAGAGSALRDEYERAVAQIFSEVLDIAVYAREANFFRLGGDSLLAIRVVILTQECLNIDLSMSSLFDNPTVASLADFVRQEKIRERTAKPVAQVARGDAIALSPQQHALWLDLKIRPNKAAYNEALAFRVKGRLEPARLMQALAQLTQRHEVLRARLIEINSEPRLVFDRAASAVEFASLEAAPDEVERKLTEAMHRPFNLAEGPLWRAMLYNEPGGESVLILVVHHVILDAASEEILLGDLIAAYSNPDALRAVGAYDFADLAAHEHACLTPEREALNQFWANNLAGAKLTLDLPSPCVPCPTDAVDDSCVSRREIGPALAGRIRDLAASWGLTPFHLYLTAYLALLRVYTANNELVVGSPVSLRDTQAAKRVVGYLLSPAALRVQLAGDSSFRDTVEDVARRWREVLAHARLPMHLALNAAEGARGIGSPIQIYFSLVRDPVASLFIDGCALRQIHIPPAHAKFDLFLLVQELQQDASFVLQYRRRTCDPEMGDRLLRHLEVLLLAATENPGTLLAKLPLADQSELAQLQRWGTNPALYSRDRTVVDMFEEVARKQKGRTALVAGPERISYSALDRRANAIAAMLRRAGVSKGDRVPLLLSRGAHFIACALGVMKCGAAYVPLDPSNPSERQRSMLEGLGARVGLGRPKEELCNDPIDWLDANLADELLSVPAQPSQIGAEDLAYVMFTSGSTGRPKGVQVPHRAIMRLVFGQDFARMGPAETWLHMAPTSFDASTLEIWAPLLHGGCCVILEDEVPTPRILDEVIRRENVTTAWITSSLFNVIVDEAPTCLAGLKQILVGGEVLSPSHIRRAFDHLPGTRLVNGYGPTENTTFTCCHVIRREDIGRTIPIGRPIANTTVHVLDCDGRRAPIGVAGELVAGGDGVALGYVGQPETTAQSRFLPDPSSEQPGARLYRSGDRVRWRPDGVLEFLGRFDNQVKIRGHRIEPGEVAACLAEIEFVRQVVVVSQPAATGAAQLVAYIVPHREGYSAPVLRKRLIRYAIERLPPYMVPASFSFLQQLPLKPNGKPDLAALKTHQQYPVPERADTTLSSAECRILAIMRNVLQNEDLNPDDDFFEAGGDSLLAITLLLRLESEFGTDLTARMLEGAYTARRLAAFLENPSLFSAKYPAGVVEVRTGTTGRPLFCLPGISSTAFQFSGLAAKLNSCRPVVAIELHRIEIEASVLESMEATAKAVVRLMREVQTDGPYAILGFSYGGNLAVEIARQLIDDHQTLELVTILDAYAPGSTRDLSGLSRIATHVRNLVCQSPLESYVYIATRLRRRLFPQSQNQDAINPPSSEIERRVAEISKPCLRALNAHRPQAFTGKITFVSATDPLDWMVKVLGPTGACGWDSLCEGGVEVIPMACGHLDILKEPYVTELAEHINKLLKAVDG